MAGARVLVVDDELDLREVLTDYLESHGYDVDAAGSGKEALLRLGEALRPYDIALVDWTMPGITGRDVVQEIVRRSPTTSVFIATGRMDAVGLPANVEAVVTVLRKPFALRDLVRVIAARLAERGPGLNSVPPKN